MAYLKPQTPLQNGADYLYPITTADQVIATDGTHRLNNELDEIREETAVIESSSTSSHAYAVGKFLTYNGILYKVTSAIAVGDTLTPGTNITATNVGDQIKSLNDSLNNTTSISISSLTVENGAVHRGSIQIKNGVCYVSLVCTPSNVSNEMIIRGFPRPMLAFDIPGSVNSTASAYVKAQASLGMDGVLTIGSGTNTNVGHYYCFSYLTAS